MKNTYIDTELVRYLPMHNAHPYFPLTNFGKKVRVIHGKTRYLPLEVTIGKRQVARK